MWTTFFSSAASASATLAGLVFVAVSVNIQRILQYPNLPSRAGSAIGTLIVVLTSSLATLIMQRRDFLGMEVLLFAILGWALEVWSKRQAVMNRQLVGRSAFEILMEIMFGQFQLVPFIVGGVLLIRDDETGMYWLATGAITTFIFGVFNAWVLLVEILR